MERTYQKEQHTWKSISVVYEKRVNNEFTITQTNHSERHSQGSAITISREAAVHLMELLKLQLDATPIA